MSGMYRFALSMVFFLMWFSAGMKAQVSTSLRDSWDSLRVLDNPHKGWYHHLYANGLDSYGYVGQDVSVIPNLEFLYLRLAWSFFEPVEDQYDWSIIDNVVNEYWPQGYKIALCITAKETGDASWQVVGEKVDGVNYATPKWVRDAGAEGMEVVNWGLTHWEPDFSDSIFLAKLADFHSALSDRYDGKPYLEYVDVCSIGDWGEGHTGFSSDIKPTAYTVKSHAAIYDSLYQMTPLNVNDDYIYWRKSESEENELVEYFTDKGYWLSDWSVMVEWWMKEGSPDTYGIDHPELFRDNYLHTPVLIECHHYKDLVDWGVWCLPNGQGCSPYGAEWLLKDIELMHASYISFQGWPDVYMTENPDFARYVANRVGYWYFIDTLRSPGSVLPGDTLRLSLDWMNTGVAPAYHQYDPVIRLEGGTDMEFRPGDSDNRQWLPDEITTEHYALPVPGEAEEGVYDILVRLVDDGESQRDIDLGFSEELKDENGFFRIGTVQIGGTTTGSTSGTSGSLEVYPNPSGNRLHYRFARPVTRLEVCSLDGKVLAMNELTTSGGNLDISGLESGMYILRVTGGQQCDALRFVKQ